MMSDDVVFIHQAALVHMAETTRVRFFMNKLIELGRPVMLVGAAGSGKTVLMQDKLNSLTDDSDNWMVANVPFNFYTTSAMLQVRACVSKVSPIVCLAFLICILL